MCCMYRKRSELFSLISTALVVALNTEGSEMCFNCINCNVKMIMHRLIKGHMTVWGNICPFFERPELWFQASGTFI